MTKKDLRERMRASLAAITPEDLYRRGLSACQRFCTLPEYSQAQVVMIFLTIGHEVDTSHIALRAWSDMKRVLAPRVAWEQRRLLPIEIHSLSSSDIRDGQMGIREPIDGMPIPVSDIDLVIVPGLAFDAYGNRLGRGRGFYDRFLSHRDFRGKSCALALQEQVVAQVPTEPGDVRVDLLVTETQISRFRESNRA